METLMLKLLRYVAIPVVLSLGLSGCQPEAAPTSGEGATTAAPVVTAPTTNDPVAWEAYVKQELQPHMDPRRFRGRPFSYFIPMVDPAAPDAPELQRQFDAQSEAIENSIGRGIQAGTMLAFAGPDSNAVAGVLEKAFTFAAPKSLNNVRIVVIANAQERARIEAAIVPSGAEFIFVDMR